MEFERIAVIGWGALAWAPGQLPLDGGFEAGGPRLDLEFSRVEPDGRLELVLDDDHGVPVETLVARSPRSTIAEAVQDVADRLQVPESEVGWAHNPGGRTSAELYPSQPRVHARVRDWLRREGWDGAVWPARAPNFEARTGLPFSPEAALSYLDGLGEKTRERATRHLVQGPRSVRTPLRKALMDRLGLEG